MATQVKPVPEGYHTLDFPFCHKTAQQDWRCFAHGVDGFTAITPGSNWLKIDPSCDGNLLAGDVRFELGGFKCSRVYD